MSNSGLGLDKCLLRFDLKAKTHTPLAKKGELLVAVLSMPTVQATLIHVFDLETLELCTEDSVLCRGCLPKFRKALGWQEHLHRPF